MAGPSYEALPPDALARLFERLPLSARARFFEFLAGSGGLPPEGQGVAGDWYALGQRISAYDGTGGLVRGLIDALHAGMHAEPLPEAPAVHDHRTWNGVPIGQLKDAELLNAIDEVGMTADIVRHNDAQYHLLMHEARRRNLNRD